MLCPDNKNYTYSEVEKWVSMGVNVNSISVSEDEEDEGSPLYYAVVKGDLTLVHYLISKGADIHQKVDNFESLLFYPAAKGDLPMVKLLVENGINFFNKTKIII